MKKQPQKDSASQKDRSNNDKGILLEQIVAMLHEEEGVRTETNVFLTPKSGDETRKREVDVLLTSNVAGYPVRVAIQCKNYRKPITVGQIGEFKDLLDDVDIPYQQGIIVSVNGFQKGAESRAKELGIKTFVLEGLDSTRLKAEIQDTFQFFVYLLLVVENINVQSEIPFSKYVFGFYDDDKKFCGFVTDLIVSQWRNGEIPMTLGQYDIYLETPKGWHQLFEDNFYQPLSMTATVRVVGYLSEMKGKLQEFKLKETETNKIEKFHLQANFDVINNVIKSSRDTPIFTEGELRKEKKNTKASIENRVRLPKIFVNNHLEPFSLKIWNYLNNAENNLTREKVQALSEVDFEKIDGEVFGAMAEKAAMDEPVVIPTNQKELIDVRLLAKQEKFDEIIELLPYFFRFPREDFAGYLTDALITQCDLMLKKSSPEKIPAIKGVFETQAFDYADKSLSLSPNQIDTYYDLGLVFRDNNLFDKSIQFLKLVISNQPQNAVARYALAEVFLKMGKADNALTVTNKAIEEIGELPLMLPLLRAKIFETKKEYKEATDDLIKVWRIDYRIIIENKYWRKLVNDVYKDFTVLGLAIIIADTYLFYALDLAEKNQLDQSQKYLDTSINLLEDIYNVGMEGGRDEFIDESLIPVLKRAESATKEINSFYLTYQWNLRIKVIDSKLNIDR